MPKATIYQGTVEAMIDKVADESMDGAVFDPPYGLSDPPTDKALAAIIAGWIAGTKVEVGGSGFKNRKWDAFVPHPEVFRAIWRKLKPGAYAVVFAGDRTQHLMGLSLALAGFEIRTVMPYLYSGGNPLKSMDMSKAIDKKLGKFDERPVKGTKKTNVGLQGGNYGTKSAQGDVVVTGSATSEAEAWEEYGTALMPFYEPWILCQKPLRGTFAENALEHGVGGLLNGSGGDAGMTGNVLIDPGTAAALEDRARHYPTLGPDEPEPPEVMAIASERGIEVVLPRLDHARYAATAPFDVGELYHSKPRRAEKDAGCETLPLRTFARTNPGGMEAEPRFAPIQVKNDHDCVKPLSLTRWLATLIRPPKPACGRPLRLLVPYSGSGSEVIGGLLAGWDEVVGIELDQKTAMEPDPARPGKERKVRDERGEVMMVEAGYCDLAAARIRHWTAKELGEVAAVEVVKLSAAVVAAAPVDVDGQLSLFGSLAAAPGAVGAAG